MAERLLRAQPVSVAKHVNARRSLIERSVTWLATESGWARSKRSAICSGNLCGGFIIFGKCYPCDTDLRCRGVSWSSIGKDDNNVSCVSAVTCGWSQHRSTDIGKRSSRVGLAAGVTKCRYRCDDWSDRSVRVQVVTRSYGRGIGEEAHSHIAAVDTPAQSADKLRQESPHPGVVACGHTTGCVHHEDDVRRTVSCCN